MSVMVTAIDLPGFLYVIYIREFEESGQSVVKVGRTKNIRHRMRSYPKRSTLLCVIIVSNMFAAETQALQSMRARFKQRRDVGNEYFEGAIPAMEECVQAAAALFTVDDETKVAVMKTMADAVQQSKESLRVAAQQRLPRVKNGVTHDEHNGRPIGAGAVTKRAHLLTQDPPPSEERVKGSSAADDWIEYKQNYKVWWGIDMIDEAFLDDNGVEPDSREVKLLMCILYPPKEASDVLGHVTSVQSNSKENRRAVLVQETLNALGFKSPFDVDNTIHDLLAVWHKTLRNTHMFAQYLTHAPLFGGGQIDELSPLCAKPEATNRSMTANVVVKMLNMVLRSCGLHLTIKRRQRGKGVARVSCSTYSMSTTCVARMVELVKLQGCERPAHSEHAAAMIAACELPNYGHLITGPAKQGLALHGLALHLPSMDWPSMK